MVRAADESLRNISESYKSLGIWQETLVILSADNGGNVNDGGNNFPLRGNKATAVRAKLLDFSPGTPLSCPLTMHPPCL
eukprot:SAG31_NODE_580_length_13940_cov_16.175349_3_plen_79_part_00